jgi:hypothetical protein
MGLDTKTDWLTDRQSQCDFDFDFDFDKQFSLMLAERIETRSSEQNKSSASEDLACEFRLYVRSSAVRLGVCCSVRLV